MSTLFREYENENRLRTYPFASGCTVEDTKGVPIGVGVFVDAVLYPVNATGDIYLSKVTKEGVVEISDENGVIMTGTQAGSVIELYDKSVLSRHAGTLVGASEEALDSLIRGGKDRKFKIEATRFASSAVFQVTNDGVLSVAVEDLSPKSGDIIFENKADDQVRVSVTENDIGGYDLRFDVVPQVAPFTLTSIRQVYCFVDGKTPFRIEKMPFGLEGTKGNTVDVYLDNITRQDICDNANRTSALEEYDTCNDCRDSSDSPCDPCEETCAKKCHVEPTPPVVIPAFYQAEYVDIPSEGYNAFFLAVPSLMAYENPLSLTLQDGVINPKLEVEVDKDGNNENIMEDTLSSKGVTLQIPGME